ncbi:hypothetical protein VNI00_013697 [Paramarasmius palmivorus]|uniref:Transmembrane protein n=1 Tax=Paramarasmius palmivorus TaxID=297713 RepID=A0AAW0BUV2_9AGAR
MGHWKHLTWAKVCVFLVLVESWVFVAVSGILMTGVGTNGDSIACSVAAWLCIICTGSAKTLIYAFLVEKIYIVWSSGFRTPRLKTKVYMICGGVLLGFAALLVAFLLGHDSHIGDNSMCILSYTRFLWLSLVAYDVLQTCFLTVMFLWPLYRSRVISPILRDVAKRTWIGALAGLTVGGVNTIILASQGGTESTWVCMNICVIDSTLNALILCWVSGPPSDPVDHFTLPAIDVTNITVGNQWKTSAMYHPTLLTGSPPSRTVAVASNYTASQGRQGIGRPQMMCECGDYENLRINSQEYRKELSVKWDTHMQGTLPFPATILAIAQVYAHSSKCQHLKQRQLSSTPVILEAYDAVAFQSKACALRIYIPSILLCDLL